MRYAKTVDPDRAGWSARFLAFLDLGAQDCARKMREELGLVNWAADYMEGRVMGAERALWICRQRAVRRYCRAQRKD
jgi:hypothetical protein